MKKNVIKINEDTIRKIVAESVKKVLNEIGDTEKGQYALGALFGRYRRDNEKYKKSPENASIDGPIFQHAWKQIDDIPLKFSDLFTRDEVAKKRYHDAEKKRTNLAKAFDDGLYGVPPEKTGYFKK